MFISLSICFWPPARAPGGGGGVQGTVACSSTIHRYHSGAVYAIIMA